MQDTSAKYKQLITDPTHWFETKISINNNEIAESGIRSLKRERPGMNDDRPSVGGALISTLVLQIQTPVFEIPQLAEIKVFVKAVTSTDSSEWIPQGTYFVDTRKNNTAYNAIGTTDISAYDSMAKADADYSSTSHNWPYADISVIEEIASTIGVLVDSRTYQFITASYMISLPAGYTMRETLENIAAAYGGNFVITTENKLLFVPLYGLDPDVTGYYLADESGNALVASTSEGWCYLV